MASTSVPAHGGDCVAAALQAHGVPVLFTLCGGHISPILTAAKARGIRIVDVRDEATAAFAADAVSRLTGIPGVAAVTAGPGLTNTLTALENAQLAQSAIVLLCGAAPTALQGRGALQDIPQRPVAAPHVKRFTPVRRVRDITRAIAEAFFVARDGVPGPVVVEIPVDVLYDEASIRQWYADASGKGTTIADRLLRAYLKRHADRLFAGSGAALQTGAREANPVLPSEAGIEAAARAICRSSRPLLVAGSQVVTEAANAPRVASAIARIGVPAYLSGMARGLLGREASLQMRHRRRDALRAADCVVLAGVPCDFRLDYGRHVRRSSTLIAANRSRHDAQLNRKPTIAAMGDAGIFLQRLAERIDDDASARWQPWIDELHARDAQREREIDAQAAAAGEYVNPLALLRAIDAAASDAAIFVADGGDFVATASYVVHPRGPLTWLDPGVFGTLGVGAGFALGAAVCRPDAEVWILFGDGACGYGLTEFDTFVRHGIAPIAVVGNDAGWTQIAREQIKLLHDDVGTTLARTAYHEVAAGFGAEGILVMHEADIPEALTRALACSRRGRPVLINVWLDRTDFREGSISM
ncbi:MAG TPA: thiamine pyrophosphate-binding protein [Candidatus Baltobacteraceae bacterium]|nr:thiamine pyrophosphate-binding protein [Candidatus Baltobacteraceae bacterium]